MEENKRPQDELRASPIVMVGVVSAILLFAIIVGFSGAFLIWEKQEAAKKTSPLAPDELRRLRSQQMGELGAYRWVSEKDGIVRIPVDRAMEIVVREAGR
ncbi:MAG: hypothetical protein ABFS86_15810 [Planctomycetota bacterium]